MGKENRNKTTQTTTTQPWDAMQPYLKDTAQQAQQMYNSGQGQQYFPGETYVGLGDTSNQALDQMQTLAGQGGSQAGYDQAAATASGQYLGAGNPYLSTIWNDQADQLTNRLKDVYSGMGRYASAPMEGELTRNLGALHANLFGGAYESERNRQLQAAGMMPQLDQARYYGADRLAAVGGARDQNSQNQRDSEVARFNFNQQAPMNALDWYNSIINGQAALGGTSTQVTQEPRRPLQKLLGAVTGIGGMIGGFL